MTDDQTTMATTDETDDNEFESLGFLTAQTADAGEQQNEQGWVFILRATTDGDGNPQKALVRKIGLDQLLEMGTLPKGLQNQLSKLFEDSQDRGKKRKKNRRDFATVAKQFAESTPLANAYVLVGFIEPRVYLTKADAEANGGVHIDQIKRSDRMAFMNACDGASEDAMERLAPFRGKPIVDVHGGPAGATVSGDGQSQPHPEPTLFHAALGPQR